MKFENTEVFNIEGALRGMRNPKNSWNKSDSYWCTTEKCKPSCLHKKEGVCNQPEGYVVGPNDMKLATALINGGTEHRKFLRQIFVSVDITAPIYWWKEADTYKIGTTANSTSTMHKVASQEITLDCFELDDYDPEVFDPDAFLVAPKEIIDFCEKLRKNYLYLLEQEEFDEAKKVWKELIRWLPCGWLQTRTVTFNYEVLANIYRQRKNHKLTEWHSFCEWVKTLPYAKEFITLEEDA